MTTVSFRILTSALIAQYILETAIILKVYTVGNESLPLLSRKVFFGNPAVVFTLRIEKEEGMRPVLNPELLHERFPQEAKSSPFGPYENVAFVRNEILPRTLEMDWTLSVTKP